MATNKFPATCPANYCNTRLPPGAGVLVKEDDRWQVFCPAHGARNPKDPHDDNGDVISKDPLVVFLREMLEYENDTTSGEVSRWFHRPQRSGRVINEVDEVVVSEGMRHVANHLELWNPIHVRENITARQLIIDLYEEAAPGSPQRAALSLALRALAMNYMDFEGFRAEWTLPRRPGDEER